MNLKHFNLDGLSTLWIASSENPNLREAIEIELQSHISNNKNFSREFIFQICKIFNHALGVTFIPSSEAYNDYGSNVVIDLLLTDDELIELVKNYTSDPPKNTHGQIRVKAIVKEQLTTEQIELLETKGFNTSDILETMHV